MAELLTSPHEEECLGPIYIKPSNYTFRLHPINKYSLIAVHVDNNQSTFILTGSNSATAVSSELLPFSVVEALLQQFPISCAFYKFMQIHCTYSEMLAPLSFKPSNLFSLSKHLHRFRGSFRNIGNKNNYPPVMMATISTVPSEKEAVLESNHTDPKPLQVIPTYFTLRFIAYWSLG